MLQQAVGHETQRVPGAAVAQSEKLSDVYNRFFYHRVALTDADCEIAHRLRYRVYCEETGFLPSDENPGGLERDSYDAHSTQCLLMHRPSETAVGTVRVVLPRTDLPGCDMPARLHAPALDTLPESLLPRASTGEISRFTIVPEFRQRSGDTVYPAVYETGGMDPRRVVPHLTLGLMTAIHEVCVLKDLTHLCAVIDIALLRLLRGLGLRFIPVGDPVEFHGRRQPVYAYVRDLMAGQAETHPDIYSVVSAGGLLQTREYR